MAGTCIRLCALDASKEEVWSAFSKAKAKAISETRRHTSFCDLLDRYFASPQFRERNPAPDVRPFRERRRDRYVTDEEYLAVYRSAPASVRVAREIAYLCAARQADVLSLRWGRQGQNEPDAGQTAVVLEQGVYIKQGKTGKAQVKLLTPRLRKALSRVKANQGKVASLVVVHTGSGQRYTRSGFETMFTRSRAKALESGAIKSSYTFHDLKAKGVSDYEGYKQKFSGHMRREQMERYNSKPDVVTALDRVKKR